jgi:GT2 family glycosyltransferase
MLTCAIMVLNWNGASWLERCLSSVVDAAKVVDAEVIVIDNASTDKSAELCRTRFPSVRCEVEPVNKVLAAYNAAARRSTNDILVFLNNDVIVERDFLSPLLAHFEKCPRLLAVAPKVLSFPPQPDSPVEMEAEFAVWTKGMLRGKPHSSTRACPTRYTLGGAMACRRTRFLALGGFDELFLPGYHEDIDFSWRGWKQGWISLYEPGSRVYHAGGGSMGRSSRVTEIQLRNEFLFHWKSISSRARLLSHVINLVPRLMAAVLRRDFKRVAGFAAALPRLRMAIHAGRKSIQENYSDDVIIRLLQANRPTQESSGTHPMESDPRPPRELSEAVLC